MRVGMGMGIVWGTFTVPVWNWVCGGLCGSKSSAGQPWVRTTDGLGLLATCLFGVGHSPTPIPSPLPQETIGRTSGARRSATKGQTGRVRATSDCDGCAASRCIVTACGGSLAALEPPARGQCRCVSYCLDVDQCIGHTTRAAAFGSAAQISQLQRQTWCQSGDSWTVTPSTPPPPRPLNICGPYVPGFSPGIGGLSVARGRGRREVESAQESPGTGEWVPGTWVYWVIAAPVGLSLG